MKLQKTPLILLAIALFLGAFVYLYEVQGKPQREAAQAQTEQLFAFKEEAVRSLTLTTPAQTLSFAKTPAARLSVPPSASQNAPSPNLAKPDSSKPDSSKPDSSKPEQAASPQTTAQAPADKLVWAMTAPDKTIANEASIAYLLNLMATGKRQQTLTVPASHKAEFGLEKPVAIAEVKLADQQTHRLILGKLNFNRSALYAQVDPPTQTKTDLSVVLVSTDFENAVSRPLPEWKEKAPTAEGDKK